jgi:hypothetical protein
VRDTTRQALRGYRDVLDSLAHRCHAELDSEGAREYEGRRDEVDAILAGRLEP